MARLKDQLGDLDPTPDEVQTVLVECIKETAGKTGQELFVECGGNPALVVEPGQTRYFRFQLSPATP